MFDEVPTLMPLLKSYGIQDCANIRETENTTRGFCSNICVYESTITK